MLFLGQGRPTLQFCSGFPQHGLAGSPSGRAPLNPPPSPRPALCAPCQSQDGRRWFWADCSIPWIQGILRRRTDSGKCLRKSVATKSELKPSFFGFDGRRDAGPTGRPTGRRFGGSLGKDGPLLYWRVTGARFTRRITGSGGRSIRSVGLIGRTCHGAHRSGCRWVLPSIWGFLERWTSDRTEARQSPRAVRRYLCRWVRLGRCGGAAKTDEGLAAAKARKQGGEQQQQRGGMGMKACA